MGKSTHNRKKLTSSLVIASMGLFALAVLTTQVRAYGLYISLALVVVGGFLMLISGMHPETPRPSYQNKSPSSNEIEEENMLA